MNFVFFSPHFPDYCTEFCVRLAHNGVRVLGIGDIPYDQLRGDLRAARTEYYRVESMENEDEVIRAVGDFTFRYGKIDRFESLNEYWLELEARIRTEFNIFGIKLDFIDNLKQKSRMKAYFKKSGVATVRLHKGEDKESALKFIDEVGYPVVAKPDMGSGASMTCKISSRRAFDNFFQNKPVKVPFVLEEFVDGIILTYDGLVDRYGHVAFANSHLFEQSVMDVVNTNGHLYYFCLPTIDPDVEEAGPNILKALDVRERFFHTPQELERYAWGERLRNYFYQGRSLYDYRIKWGGSHRLFGEWYAFNRSSSPVVLPPGLLPKRREDANYMVRVLRDVFGRLVRIELWSERGMPLGSFSYWTAPVALSMPSWAIFHDLNELILCDSMETAEAIERVVAAWPQEERIPIAIAVNPDCFPIACNLPYPKVSYMTREDGICELGLVLYQKGLTEVKVRHLPGNHNDPMPALDGMTKESLCHSDLPDCMEAVVSEIVHGPKETMVGRLSTVMSRPYITGEHKRELLQRCAAAVGRSEDNLLNQLEAGANPYALLDRGRLFVGRSGKYFMKDRQGRWSEISNFSIRSITKTINAKGDAIHNLRLSVDGLTTTFSVTDALLDSPPRLWKEARRAAALAGLPELIMTNAQHRALVPELIKSTAQVAYGR